jgi:GNAT superfamily N-acetyltransferase
MTTTRLRDAVPDDLDEIGALIGELADYERMRDEIEWSVPEEFGRWLFGPEAVAWVTVAEIAADAGWIVAGMALWFPTFSTFQGRPGIWLEDLFVRPEHRGLGLGKALITDLFGRTDGRVEWTVLDWNEPSIAFYRSLGAEPVDGWTRYRWTAPR